MLGRLLMVIAALGFAFRPACGATIEIVKDHLRLYGIEKEVDGIKIEGEIETGDTLKLLKTYEYFGPFDSSLIFLRSRGGNLEEAIKMGKLI